MASCDHYGTPPIPRNRTTSWANTGFLFHCYSDPGYVRFRNWRLYGERGLAGEPASIWVTDEEVTIQADDDPLATYGVKYQRDHRHFRQVIPKQIFETRHGSPQPPLLELGPDDWLLAIEQPTHHRRRRRRSSLVQAELFGPDEAVAGR